MTTEPENGHPESRKRPARGKLALAAVMITATICVVGWQLHEIYQRLQVTGPFNEQLMEQSHSRTEAFDRWSESGPFKAFTADPVWESTEWAAIVDAEDARNTAVWDGRLAEMRERAKDKLHPADKLLERADSLYELATEPMEKQLPLTKRSMREPLIQILRESAEACRSGDVEAWLADWDAELPAYPAAPDADYVDVWTTNAPVIIRAGAEHYCGN